MKRTTLYLDPDLEARLKQEMRLQKRPMAELVRDAVRRYLEEAPTKQPPGAGAFASDRKHTASRAEALLEDTGFGEDR